MRTFAYITRPRRPSSANTAQLAPGVQAVYRPVTLASGRAVDLAELDVSQLSDGEWDALVARMRVMPGYTLHAEVPALLGMQRPEPVEASRLPAVVEAPAAPVATPAPMADPVDLACSVARSNGWDAEDLRGVGMGGLIGVGGGHSPVSGMTLVEMTLSVPPEGWATRRESSYPWDDVRWVPPAGFKPRSPPKKTVVAEPDGALLPRLNVVDDAPDEESPATADTVIVPATPATDAATPATSTPDAGDHVHKLVREMIAESEGAIPSLVKVNFRLVEAKHKKITGVMLAAVVAALTPPTS